MFELLKEPEVWLCIVFCCLVLIAAKPVKGLLATWGKTRAEQIQKSLDEPAALRAQAEELYAKYENHTRNRDKERADMLNQTEAEIEVVQKEFRDKLKARLDNKEKEADDRAKALHVNGLKAIKNQVWKSVLDKAYDLLEESTDKAQADLLNNKSLNDIFATIKDNPKLVK